MIDDLVRRIDDMERRLRDMERQEAAQSGTFTPTLVGATIAGTFTYDTTNTSATWARVGNLVFVSGRVRITAISVSPTGDLTIRTLPYTAATTGRSVNGGLVLTVWNGLDIPAGFTQVEGQVVDAETQITIVRSGDNTAAARVQGGEVLLVGGAVDFRFAGFYFI
jgi:hypothetical protein